MIFYGPLRHTVFPQLLTEGSGFLPQVAPESEKRGGGGRTGRRQKRSPGLETDGNRTRIGPDKGGDRVQNAESRGDRAGGAEPATGTGNRREPDKERTGADRSGDRVPNAESQGERARAETETETGCRAPNRRETGQGRGTSNRTGNRRKPDKGRTETEQGAETETEAGAGAETETKAEAETRTDRTAAFRHRRSGPYGDKKGVCPERQTPRKMPRSQSLFLTFTHNRGTDRTTTERYAFRPLNRSPLRRNEASPWCCTAR